MMFVVFVALLFATLGSAGAQWLNYPAPGTPRTKDGKPNLTAKAPRMAGKPDLSGVWQIEPAPTGEIERMLGKMTHAIVPGDDPTTFSKYFFNIMADFKPEEAPIRPDTFELWRKHGPAAESPSQQCLPTGIPSVQLLAFPFKIVQAPSSLVMMYELDGTFRQVHTDGRKLPVDPQPAWLGYSAGKWEGDTLVVDTIGINERTWLDAMAHPHSDSLRIQERFHRRDFGHLDMQITIDDPKMYTKPFTFKVVQLLMPDSDILESICNENERSRAHMPGR